MKPTMIGCSAPLWGKGVEFPPESILNRLRVIDSVPNVVPFLKLYTGDWQPSGPFLKADDILSGKEDWRFIRLAEQSKVFGKPYLLSINHEMNGDWFYFSEPFKKQPTDWTAEKYKLVWRRIHKIFQDNGATNVAFAWCPGAMGRKFGKYDSVASDNAAKTWRNHVPTSIPGKSSGLLPGRGAGHEDVHGALADHERDGRGTGLFPGRVGRLAIGGGHTGDSGRQSG